MLNPVELTRELLHYETICPPATERDCAEHLGRLLEPAGFSLSRHEFAPGRTTLVARLGGSGPPLCMTGHLDVVPLGAAPWSRDPFAGEIDGPKLYGRGSSDMKSGVAAMVAAAIEIARHPRKAGVLLVLTSGEETGCLGAEHAARHAALGGAGALLVGEPTGNQPLVGHKGALWLRARTRGVTAHGSMPERGDNAVYKMARAIARLEKHRLRAEADPLLGAPTFNVGTIAGGLNTNSVPDRCEITIDLRTVPSQHDEQLRTEIGGVLGEGVEIEIIQGARPVRTDEKDPWVAEVADVLAGVTGTRPAVGAAPYFTDASALRPALGGPPTIILGPGELALCHQTDEHCYVAKVEHAAVAYLEILRRWCRA